jgi:hypothetical protein
MSNEEKQALAPYVNALEQRLSAINAPFHVHIAQKEALKAFWDGLGTPAPQLPLNGQETAKKSFSKRRA